MPQRRVKWFHLQKVSFDFKKFDQFRNGHIIMPKVAK